MASALQLNSDTALALVCATTALRRRSSSPIRVQHRGGSPAPQWPLPSLVTAPRPVAAAYMAGGLYGRRPVAGGRATGSSPHPNPPPHPHPHPNPDQV